MKQTSVGLTADQITRIEDGVLFTNRLIFGYVVGDSDATLQLLILHDDEAVKMWLALTSAIQSVLLDIDREKAASHKALIDSLKQTLN